MHLHYAKSGNLVHVYFSGKAAVALDANTEIVATGLPNTIVQQDCRVTSAYERGDIEVITASGNSKMTLLTKAEAGYWIRFSFSYISAT